MHAKREIRLRKFCVKAVRQHRARAADRFFRRLSDEQNRPVPLIFHFRERLRRAEKNRHVNVVTARVHDVHLFALVILRHDFARVGQTGFLLDRQRIEIGAHQHGRPGAVLHHADHAVTFQSRVCRYLPKFSVTSQPAAFKAFATIAAVRCSCVDNSGLVCRSL